jgi:hypothetical protein
MPGDSIALHRFQSASDSASSYLKDFRLAVDQAVEANDHGSLDRLLSLHMTFFNQDLRTMGAGHLRSFLESQAVWRIEKDWPIYKTAGEPCIAFTARIGPDDTIHLIALAACYRYPDGSADTWWTRDVQPRVRQL